MAKKTGLRAAIYCRISEDRYGEAEGVERQQEACEKLAADRGLDVVATFMDNNRSAMKGKRPAYEQLCEAVTAGEVDVVLVLRTDRLYRQLKELTSLMEVLRDTPVYSVKSGDVDLSNADGRLRANIMGSVAQHESEVKAERVSDAAKQRAARGRSNGGGRARFGYQQSASRTVILHRGSETVEMERPTGPFMLKPTEADAIEWAYEQVLLGATLRAVLREWESRGLTLPNGNPLTAQAVRDILLRPMNAGLSVYKGQILEAVHEAPAIVSVETWRGVVAILTNPSRRTSPLGRPTTTLLGPVLKCAVCLETGNLRYHGRITTKRRAAPRDNEVIYSCITGAHVVRSQARLDAHVSAIAFAYIVANASRLQRPVAKSTRAAKQATRMQELQDKLAKWSARSDDFENIDDYLAIVNPIRAELTKLTKAAEVTNDRPATAALLRSEDVRITWDEMDTDAKRAVITENILRITIGRGVNGSRDNTMIGVRLFDRDGKEIEFTGWPAGTGGDLTYTEAMAEWMPEMTDEVARRVSAAMYPA